jgi:hypothetical protein
MRDGTPPTSDTGIWNGINAIGKRVDPWYRDHCPGVVREDPPLTSDEKFSLYIRTKNYLVMSGRNFDSLVDRKTD